jgi:adenosylcobinamide-GDP ribazoletransferase
MKKEIRIFFTALMFLTRLPVPRFTDHAPEYLEKAAKYFPLIGWIVGGISVFFLLFCYRFLSIDLAVLASIIAGILTTGAFHEDGFADTCDAFGGGWTKEKILEIMKDSRLGTYGVTGLVLILAAKFLLLRELVAFVVNNSLHSYVSLTGIVLLAHSFSRLMPVFLIQTSTYVFAKDKTKSKPLASRKLGAIEALVAIFLGAFPLMLLPPFAFVIVIPILLSAYLMRRYFQKWIGGYTGDCLGATQQISELVCYLTLLLLWRYT